MALSGMAVVKVGSGEEDPVGSGGMALVAVRSGEEAPVGPGEVTVVRSVEDSFREDTLEDGVTVRSGTAVSWDVALVEP